MSAVPAYGIVRLFDDPDGRVVAGAIFDRIEAAIDHAENRAFVFGFPYGVVCLDNGVLVYRTETGRVQ